jgi:RIO-like serine/threonine protein kinase
MVTKRHVLHGDLSPNNLIIHDGKGYFIDFDHAKFLKNNAATDSRGTVSYFTMFFFVYLMVKFEGHYTLHILSST